MALNRMFIIVLMLAAIGRAVAASSDKAGAIIIASGHIHTPQVVVDAAGNVNVVWSDSDIDSRGTKILYARSTDHGANFSSPVLITSNNSRQPFLTVGHDGAVFVLWVDVRQQQIMLATSKDGSSFSAPVNIAAGESPCAQVDRFGVLYVAWDVLVVNHFEIRIATSHDWGKTFSSPVSITTGAEGFRSPAIAVDERGAPLVAWEGAGISVSRSENGSNFKTTTLLRGMGAEDHLPSLKAGARGRVYLTWEALAGKQYAIMFSRSEDDGRTFAPPIKIVSSPVSAWDPKLDVAADGTITLVWSSSPGAIIYNQYINFARSSDEGHTFSHPTALSDFAFSFHPSISVDSAGNSYLVLERWKSATVPSEGSDLLLVVEPTSSMTHEGISH